MSQHPRHTHGDAGYVRRQLALDFPLDVDELDKRDASDVENAAALFVAKDHHLPYYYGPHCVAQLGAYNIEQFLELAGDLFEQLLTSSAITLSRRHQLSAIRQIMQIRNVSHQKYHNLSRDVPYGVDVQRIVRPSVQYAEKIHIATLPLTPLVLQQWQLL